MVSCVEVGFEISRTRGPAEVKRKRERKKEVYPPERGHVAREHAQGQREHSSPRGGLFQGIEWKSRIKNEGETREKKESWQMESLRGTRVRASRDKFSLKLGERGPGAGPGGNIGRSRCFSSNTLRTVLIIAGYRFL